MQTIKNFIKKVFYNTLFFRRLLAIIIFIGFAGYEIFVHPPRTIKRTQRFIYILDAGHGFRDNSCGYKSVLDDDMGCWYEWRFNFDVRKKLAHLLDSAGFTYRFLRRDTMDDNISNRAKRVNNIRHEKPLFLISIHSNAQSKNDKKYGQATGFETFIAPNNGNSDKFVVSTEAAKIISTIYSEDFPEIPKRKAWREKNFTILKTPNCAGILTENLFFTTKKDRDMLKDEGFRWRIARAHFKLILELEAKNKTNPNEN